MRTVTTRLMREIDRRTQRDFGIPEMLLMEHAGFAVAQRARVRYRKAAHRKKGARVLVAAGPGANGGDGFVAARHLDNWGIPVEVLIAASPERIQGAAQRNLTILNLLQVTCLHIATVWAWVQWRKRDAEDPALIIDALLGIGVTGKVREPIAGIIRWINQQRCPVLSIDVPSGLSADEGQPCGMAVRADETITCGLPKVGLCLGEGPRYSGKVVVADISLPRPLRL